MANRKSTWGRRTDLGTPVDGYLSALSGPVREICDTLVAVVREAVPDAAGEIKWGMPVFSHHGLLCYIRARPGYVRFGFYDHTEGLDDPEHQLEGKNVKYRSVEEIDRERLVAWIRVVAEANEKG